MRPHQTASATASQVQPVQILVTVMAGVVGVGLMGVTLQWPVACVWATPR